jgi:hypothetical protein
MLHRSRPSTHRALISLPSTELTMTDPTTSNPTQLQRGSVVPTTALRISTLLPREQEAIFSILRTLNAAHELLPRLADLPGSDAYGMRLLLGIVDNYPAGVGQPRPLVSRTPRSEARLLYGGGRLQQVQALDDFEAALARGRLRVRVCSYVP